MGQGASLAFGYFASFLSQQISEKARARPSRARALKPVARHRAPATVLVSRGHFRSVFEPPSTFSVQDRQRMS
ncbi:hypothetical protein V6N12_072497 [Hibiscus sabdariffa]|uniref:Uncharacterized protein n=1 Tax=Hibiscus sabdariffa TaxID=183260 RepID=A0ABR2AR24_9ROSI